MPSIEISADEKIAACDRAVDGAFVEEDLYFRTFYFNNLMIIKWRRAALLQGGL